VLVTKGGKILLQRNGPAGCAASQRLFFLIANIAKSIRQYGGWDLGIMVKYAP
jgi:hypothetical protein